MKILGEVMRKGDLAKSEVIFEGPMVKGVVDIKRELLAIDAGMHADMEQLFLGDGSARRKILDVVAKWIQ